MPQMTDDIVKSNIGFLLPRDPRDAFCFLNGALAALQITEVNDREQRATFQRNLLKARQELLDAKLS